MALIFIWYLVTVPTDRIVCNLWSREVPDRNTLMSACGFFEANSYRLDVVPLGGKTVACSRPGDMLPVIEDECHLPQSLDQYVIRIVWPKFTELVCSVAVEHAGQPTRGEIQEKCGEGLLLQIDSGSVIAKYVGSQPKPPAVPPTVCEAASLPAGFGLYDQAPDVESLWTDEPLTWLAGRMIWFGMIRPACAGGRSGLDPETLAANGCGMAAASAALLAWQNQFNADIYRAASAYKVPARLIKRIIAVESQYWPTWSNTGGEAGMLQVSQNGVDVLLRYDAGLDPAYPKRPLDQQYWKRLEVLQILACAGCSLTQTVEHMHLTIPIYARLLAAYRCRAVEINPALAGADAWRQAVIDYNGSKDYLAKVEL